jgi:hypothetical protein
MPDLEVEKFQCTLCDSDSLRVDGPCFAKPPGALRVEKPAAARG